MRNSIPAYQTWAPAQLSRLMDIGMQMSSISGPVWDRCVRRRISLRTFWYALREMCNKFPVVESMLFEEGNERNIR